MSMLIPYQRMRLPCSSWTGAADTWNQRYSPSERRRRSSVRTAEVCSDTPSWSWRISWLRSPGIGRWPHPTSAHWTESPAWVEAQGNRINHVANDDEECSRPVDIIELAALRVARDQE